MSIQQRVDALIARMAPAPVYPTQGRVLFVDLADRTTRSAWLPEDAVRRFVGGRGANMYLLYNLMNEQADPLAGDNPLIFGSGVLTGYIGTATRGNVSGLSPDSDALRSHLYNLRKAIDKPFDSSLLHNVQGMGYRLAATGDE